MKLKKKLATVVAMAAIFSSIVTPITAQAACSHDRVETKRALISSYTTHHAYDVGEDDYRDCFVTIIEEVTYHCPACNTNETKNEITRTHSSCGL